MIVRNATPEDISIIQLITYNTWPQAYKNILSAKQISYMLDLLYSTATLKKQMVEGNDHFIIANENYTDIAFASFSLIDDKIFKLHKLYALPDQQGKGTGKFLINYIIDEIKKNKAEFLQLNVNRNNNAKYFYEHLGFKIIREENIDIGNGFFMNDYVMEKKLTVQ